MRLSLGLKICKKMAIKIDEIYHVASCCCPSYVHQVFGKNTCHFTMKERWWGLFFSKTSWRIKDNNTSPHGKFNRFLSPFSSKFSDLNFASYVLYIYLCYGTCHIKWAWVTDDIDMLIRFSCRSYINNSWLYLVRKIRCEESSVIVSH